MCRLSRFRAEELFRFDGYQSCFNQLSNKRAAGGSEARVVFSRFFINRPIFASLPNDFRKASQSVNLGTPLMENHNNVLTNRYRQIAGQLVGIDTSVDEKKSPLSGLFSFPSKK